MATKPSKPSTARSRTASNPTAPQVEDVTKQKRAIGGGATTARQSEAPQDGPDPQDVDLARETLRAVCRDGNAPAAARAQAARTLAEMAGALGRHAAPPAPAGKALADMTRDELEAELAGLSGA